jgi:hypothetical protein
MAFNAAGASGCLSPKSCGSLQIDVARLKAIIEASDVMGYAYTGKTGQNNGELE